MKRILLFSILILSFFGLKAQVFWTETFDGSPCPAGSGCDPSIVGWTQFVTGAEGGAANEWYVSDREAGLAPPACGVSGGGDQSLHVGNVPTSTAAGIFCPTGDCGAAYDDSGPGEITNRRAESPTINCTGQTNITVDFNYIENGEGSDDDASFWYFDGATWSNLNPIAKSAGGCAPQGQWTAVTTINLPASANNNPNVKIGFLWVNDGDGSASDPSFAVDDITLTNNGPITGPTASFSSSDSTLCVGDCISFTDLSTGSPTGWTWYFPGSATPTSTAQNPTNICYNTAGSFAVSLVADDGTNTDSLYMPNFITVNPLPNITANASPSNNVCIGDMVTLTGGGGVSYSWTGGVTNGNPFPAVPGSTLYTVTGTDANGCTNTANITVTANNCTQPTASFTADSLTICAGGDILFTDNSTGTGITTWSWTFNGGTPPTANTQGPHNVTFNTPGVYNITLQITDANGTDDTTIVVTVNNCNTAIPTAGISMSDADGEICVNNCIDFTYDGGTGGTPTSINWTFEGGTPSTYNSTNPNEVITVCWNDTTGTFNVSITASNTNGSSNSSTTVVVHEEPVVNAGLDTSVIIGQSVNLNANATDTAGNPVSGGTFMWSPAIGLSCPGCQSTTILEALQSGLYTVTYTDQYGCVVTDDVYINVDIALNIGVPSAFSPNGDGSNDLLFVKGTHVIETLRFTIFNRYGQKVFETTDKTEGWDGTHNGTELNPGVFVYYLNVVFVDNSTGELKGNVTLVR